MAKKKSKDQEEYDLLCAKMRSVLSTEDGKDVIWAVLSMCDVYSNVFTGNSQTFFLEGKRAVGLEFLQLLEDADRRAYPELLLRNLKESSV